MSVKHSAGITLRALFSYKMPTKHSYIVLENTPDIDYDLKRLLILIIYV